MTMPEDKISTLDLCDAYRRGDRYEIFSTAMMIADSLEDIDPERAQFIQAMALISYYGYQEIPQDMIPHGIGHDRATLLATAIKLFSTHGKRWCSEISANSELDIVIGSGNLLNDLLKNWSYGFPDLLIRHASSNSQDFINAAWQSSDITPRTTLRLVEGGNRDFNAFLSLMGESSSSASSKEFLPPWLQELEVSDLGNVGYIDGLRNHPSLRKLSLESSDNRPLLSGTLENIASCRHLDSLAIHGANLTNRVHYINNYIKNPSLRSLDLQNAWLRESDISSIAEMTQLERLSICSNQLPILLTALPPALKHLRYSGNKVSVNQPISPEDLDCIAQSSLHSLNLDSYDLRGLVHHLASYPAPLSKHLKELEIRNCQLNEEDMGSLTSLPLERLSLSDNPHLHILGQEGPLRKSDKSWSVALQMKI